VSASVDAQPVDAQPVDDLHGRAAVAAAFARARVAGRAALIGYYPAGFPDPQTSVAAMTAMLDAGVDVLEVGLPYSDPLMDGPMIARAVEQALTHRCTTDDILGMAGQLASGAQPILIMTYWNPIEQYGPTAFAARARAAGLAGVITPDLTPEESGPWQAACEGAGLARVYLVAPTSSDERLRLVAGHCTGFVYAASLMGVTGTRAAVSDRAAPLVARVRSVTDLPVCVGLGVSTGEQAAAIAEYADGVIVGSAFIARALAAGAPERVPEAVAECARELAAGVRAGRAGVGHSQPETADRGCA